MRIAYCAGYQGPQLIKQRNICRNRTLAGSYKMHAIVRMLEQKGHEVEVFSHGVTAERSFRYFPELQESVGSISTVYYSRCFDAPVLNLLMVFWGLLSLLKKRNTIKPFDVVVLYNLPMAEMRCGFFAFHKVHVPIILEYEDDACMQALGSKSLLDRWRSLWVNRLMPHLGGCFAASNGLLNCVPTSNKYLLRGLIDEELIKMCRFEKQAKEKIVLYTGGLFSQKGIDALIDAWQTIFIPGWQLHITGIGPLEQNIKKQSALCTTIVFYGMLNRSELNQLLCRAAICVNPHRISSATGNIFPFKIVEYLASNAHVLTTTIEDSEPEFGSGITMISSDKPQDIARALEECMQKYPDLPGVAEQVFKKYNLETIADNLDTLIRKAVQ